MIYAQKEVYIAKFSVIKKFFEIKFYFFQNICIMANKDGKDKQGGVVAH